MMIHQPPFERKPQGICFGLEGIITLTTRDESENITGQITFPNLILDSGLDHLGGNTASIWAVCKIGTGSTAVNVAQTALATPAATTTTTAPGGDTFHAMTATSPRYNRAVFRRRFAAGSLNGTYTEIGFGPASGSLFNRALISPTKTVLATETLDVEYELRTYIPAADVTGSATIGATSHTFTLRPVNINSGSTETFGIKSQPLIAADAQPRAYTGGALAAQTAYEPTYSALATGVVTLTTPDAYVAGTGYRKLRYSWTIDQLNVAGGSLNKVKLGVNCASWQIEFSPAVAKDATKTMSLDIGVTFARYP